MDPSAINCNVLRRHDSHITSIIDSTSYVVIYRYFHGAWSKTGLEGTMFIFQRDTPPLYGVFVLNRQGLDNMSQSLLAGWEVDLDEGLIIWRSEGATGEADDDIIHGLWIYEEKDRSRIAGTMQSLIDLSTPQPEPERVATPPPVSLSHPVPRVPIIPAGQSISLDQLFGVGSVCSDLPPQTSALPHPGTSVADPEETQAHLPQNVMSPDPSDLPKGMQLLDSLFQKAGIKPQPVPKQAPAAAPQPVEQPTTVHQLLQHQHQQPSAQRPSLQGSVSASSSQQAHPPHTRERRRSSADENYKPQSYVENGTNQGHRGHPQHGSRGSNPNAGGQQSSRRSSGGSSSHARSEKPNSHSAPQYHSQQVMVPAPIPIESANAEARHNILSLLGHPAAAVVVPNHSGPGSNPGSHHSGGWAGPNGSPDSARSGGYQYQHPYSGRNVGGGGPGSERTYNSVRSQHPSPQQATQDNHHHQVSQPSPPDGSHHYHQHQHRSTPPKPPLPPVPRQAPGSSTGYNGPHAWTSNRALSPLNPAHNHHTQQAPRVNDSSRPSRANSMLKTKLAAEVVDEALASSDGSQREDAEALDKKEFVGGIIELLKSNGAFVDTLYARYLARYAEKYL
ncbi:hypothetical protein CROQUDRAFT_653375 [Cronartium quercuum f. sp. fusiforme G11]|uniref:Uncharacterized protein n=1 Tax=Cronartium quercuum f. sp. fusiforme G11 TaxID=708437 RepID=A0A9P6NSS2_9BASI|nr:hypothetical protein CROQUDRAFT_653375 [Cronartium quercuum f. sp. fusiforme G11]